MRCSESLPVSGALVRGKSDDDSRTVVTICWHWQDNRETLQDSVCTDLLHAVVCGLVIVGAIFTVHWIIGLSVALPARHSLLWSRNEEWRSYCICEPRELLPGDFAVMIMWSGMQCCRSTTTNRNHITAGMAPTRYQTTCAWR